MKKLYLSLIFLLCFPGWLLAAPSISSTLGTWADAQNIVISGANFGAKTVPAPAIWDDFDHVGAAYDVGDPVAVADGWEIASPTSSYNSTATRTGSTKHVRSTWDGTSQAFGFGYAHGATLSPLYVTFWIKQDWTSSEEGGSADQCKWFRIWHDSHAEDPVFTGIMQWATASADPPSWANNLRRENSSYESISSFTDPVDNTWFRMEFYLVESSPLTTANGTVFAWHQIGGEGNTFTKELNHTDIAFNTVGGTNHLEEVWFSDYGRYLVQTLDLDDIYIDDTQQRVEIGDNETWANCTHREIQIPSAWADGEITITVNAGSIANLLDGNHYLFVIDSNGNVSPGSPLVEGGAVTGTVIPGGCTESKIVSGGKTVVVTVSGTTFVATFGDNNAVTTAFIQGFDSAQAEAGGWDAKMITAGALTHAAVTRTDANTATVILPAVGTYQITSAETITLTIPATSTEADDAIVATPDFVISAEYIGAENVSATYDANGPAVTYNANGPAITAP